MLSEMCIRDRIVTDWADINNLYSRDHIAKDKKDAIKLAINAGIDMSMDPYDWKFCTLLKELVEEGEVPMSRIDDAVRREMCIRDSQWMVAASSADVRCTAVQRVTKARKQKVHDAMRAQVPVAVYPMVKR